MTRDAGEQAFDSIFAEGCEQVFRPRKNDLMHAIVERRPGVVAALIIGRE
jgi:hypothetical protein